jgi:hypothetical protein
MKPEWILENTAVVRWRSWATIITVIVVAVTMMCVGLIYGREDGFEAAERQYTAELAEKDGELAGKEAALTEKDEKLAKKEAELREYQIEAEILDENGVRTDRMSEVYTSVDPYGGSEITTDAEFRVYCRENYPEAVLPTEEWTLEGVANSWLESPEIWGVWTDSYNDLETYFVWSADYEHCFYLDAAVPIIPVAHDTGEHRELVSGWLVVDGVRVMMLDKQTYDIDDPYEMLRQYQAGEWDGSMRRSHDGSTTVEVDWTDGHLEYQYEAWRYDQTTDPLGMAYAGFEDEAWWKREGVSKELLMALGERNTQYASWNEDGTHGYDWLYRWDFYADLPGGISAGVEGLGAIYGELRTQRGTFFMTSTGVWLYKQGELVDHWECELDEKTATLYNRCALPKTAEEIAQLDATRPEIEDESGAVTFGESEQQKAMEYANEYAKCQELGLVSPKDQVYAFTGSELLLLGEGGAVAAFFNETVTMPKDYSSTIWGLKDGRLVYWRGYKYSDANLPKVAAEDVIEADFTDLALFMKADGCYEVPHASYSAGEVRYLGPETMGYYQRLYQTLAAARY